MNRDREEREREQREYRGETKGRRDRGCRGDIGKGKRNEMRDKDRGETGKLCERRDKQDGASKREGQRGGKTGEKDKKRQET